MQLNTVDTNRVKFEARNYPPPQGPKSGSGFWRFLQGLGALATPVSFASSLFFPPAALIGAGSYGLFHFSSYKDEMKRREQAPAAMPVIYYPGINTPVGGPQSPVAGGPTTDPLNLISGHVLPNRQAMTNELVGEVK